RIGDELGMGAEFDKLIRVREQRQDPVADQVCGGEVAGHQQQVAGNNDLTLGQPIPKLLGSNERADEVGAAPVASLLDRMSEIIIEARRRGRQLCRLFGRAAGVEDLRAGVRPALEPCEVAGSTPSISTITMVGSGAAYSAITSNVSRPLRASSSPSAMTLM